MPTRNRKASRTTDEPSGSLDLGGLLSFFHNESRKHQKHTSFNSVSPQEPSFPPPVFLAVVYIVVDTEGGVGGVEHPTFMW